MKRMKIEEEEMWMSRAIDDSEMVAELILRLKQSTTATPKLEWGIRQPRSKSSSSGNIKLKKRDSIIIIRRCSPTTPLSWTDDSSPTVRSKDTCTDDFVAFNSANKCSKRKKSFNEFQEEETRLLKGVHLNTESETLHGTLNKQKVKSENMTRQKTDLHQQSAFEVVSKPYISEGLNFHQANGAKGSTTDYIQASNEIKAERGFVLPDLNMTPSEDDCAIVSLNGFRLSADNNYNDLVW